MIKINKPCAEYIIGTAREMKSIYDRLWKKTCYSPLFVDEPKFNPNRIYGIEIDLNEEFYTVIGETDVCYLLMGEV